MGQGIDLARGDAPLHAQVIDDFKDQVLLALVRRLGGTVDLPVAECDDTGGLVMVMRMTMEPPAFHFEVKAKQ